MQVSIIRFKILKIYHECEDRIEKSCPRITVWHEVCRVITNGDIEGEIFLSYLHMNNGFFFMLSTVFYFKISFRKSLICLDEFHMMMSL